MESGTTNTREPKNHLPAHVGIIMDGNGRWAKSRFQPRVFGHRHGVDSVRQVVKASGEWGIKALTLYAFSDENWQRPRDEVGVIMGLLETYIRKEQSELNKNNVQLRVIGDTSRLSPQIKNILDSAVAGLASNTGLILTLALSYGSRQEMTRAVQSIALKISEGLLKPSEIDSHLINEHLDTKGLPDPDLIIRTSGEQRLSNFLLWQSAYSELYFTQVMWPDFNREEYQKAIDYYGLRERRFGKTGDQLSTGQIRADFQGSTPC